MRWIPEARSVKWWMMAGVSTVLVSAFIWTIRFAVLGQTFTLTHAFRFLALAAILSALFGLAGWLGGRWIWLFSNLGLGSGLVAMALYSTDLTGWEDLVGFLAFLMLTVIGFAVGLLVQLGVVIMKRVKK